MEKRSQIVLSLLGAGEKLTIEALDAEIKIVDAQETFNSYLDPDFENLDLDKDGLATTEISVDVVGIKESAKFCHIFNFITPYRYEAALTPKQIITFCKKHQAWLNQDGPTLFLTVKKNEYFVAVVYQFSYGLEFHLLPYKYRNAFDAKFHPRLVFRKLNK